MNITVLSENTICKNPPVENLCCEHGLCLYVQTKNHTFLFDSGHSPLFAENAEKLNIDLSKVEFMILSHGHYDHGGGIEKFFQINKTAPVYLSRFAFEPHWHEEGNFIGLDENLLKNKDRIIFCNEYLKIDDELEIFSTNNQKPKYPIIPYGLHTQRDGKFIDEDFRHEQYLQINQNNKKIILSGCSHKGILNIQNWFKPDVLAGGFHYMTLDCNIEEDSKIITEQALELKKIKTKFYTCHCTGEENYELLKSILQEQIDYAATGQTIQID